MPPRKSMAQGRIKREIAEVKKDKQLLESGTVIKQVKEGDYTHLHGSIRGAPDTPYEGGTFELDIQIPDTYPFSPPKVKFLTRIWHPNVSSQTGAICLDILKDQWAAAMTLRTVLLSLQALMAAAEPDDPQDAVVAKQVSPADEHTAELSGKLQQLVDMGIDAPQARDALSATSWNVEAAIARIYS
ncbi:ubiquitin-conjugating enzyme E2-25kD [Salpingoeca rosetta]|uniref:Ubiquitin-conjugating enzyme E2-25kD n=1 Tax=Salpingoeca rosetta (strain ATCC 50818 / BSB-021) TaxID=946362 RepID=F2UJP6_SALR5|nr:ubiquitin-conjugating enzyme E2-25kD [Salpingoeca rosetta]EGD77345.1 ubiquitin-conjugating enzyme E2-25kD [Salpingoeca rosetta]|eukprot:XP_004990689.1 ubiquitin-conjugating enzyme E2-25kD [Salpingoeca rosetta]